MDTPEHDGASAMANNDIKILATKAAYYKQQLDDLEAKITALKEPYGAVIDALQSTLELLDIKKVSMQGYEFKVDTKSSVTIPKTEEEKKALWAYLESKDLAWQIFGVNSATLNKTYNELAAQELEENGTLDFELPGVGKPTSFNVLKVKKEKVK